METGKFKPSHYNFMTDLPDGEALLYNMLTGILVKLSPENKTTADRFLANSDVLPTDDRETELMEALRQSRFLIPENTDEIKFLKAKNRIARFGGNKLDLIIAPTFDCNFRCPYCYEERQNVVMTPEGVSAVKNMINRHIDEKGIKYAQLAWYGGEPLLEKNTIYEISETLKRIEYKATAYTNGYLLDPAFIERLEDLRINILYITLDGPQAFHDQRRYLQGKHPTYARIRENIFNTVARWGQAVKVIIRVNLDAENLPRMEELLSDFSELREKIAFTISRTGLKPDIHDYPMEILNPREYDEHSRKIEELILKNRFGKPKLPTQAFNACPADLLNSYCIDPMGNLFKCISQMNPAITPLGKLRPDGSIEFNEDEYTRWYGYDIFEDAGCRECLFFPFCMGGCPVVRWPFKTDAAPDGAKPCYYGKDKELFAQRIKRYYYEVYLQEQAINY